MMRIAILILGILAARVAVAEDLFRDSVAPIFEHRCVHCHSGVAAQGGLDLSTAAGIHKGGESGAVFDAANPGGSLLIEYVSGEKPAMPKNGDPLSAAEIDALRQWVAAGAAWPDDVVLRERWWSFEPLVKPALPAVAADDAERVRTPVDAFVLAKLRQEKLSPSPEADRRTLIRRLTYDLHGLPPTPGEIDAFVSDPRPDAYEQLVDRLLASPHYGEHWARHWLDVAHYGDTHGYDKDKRRPNSWPYRDYVIRSLNADKPWSQFVREQIAGDVLSPGDPDGIVATGFVVAGPWDFVGHAELREGTTDKNITRVLDRDDMVTNVMSSFASLTVHCARCHDHKFDPIAQADYYSLQAVFAGVERADRVYRTDGAGEHRVYSAAAKFDAYGSFTPPPEGKPRPIHVLARGSVGSPGEIAESGTVACIEGLPARFALAQSDDEGSRRAALAEWMTDSRNPLVWRSIVNRVWHYHFGRGIVDSPNDFGRMGARPTHPELLDWLAAEFRDGRQSLKELHRLIVTSTVYRQSSQSDEAMAKIDAANRYLWRMDRRRLNAEAIRDSVLSVSDTLRSTMYGPGYDLFGFIDDHSPHYLYEQNDADAPATLRRTVYRFVVRSVPDPLMETLDCADPSINVPVRNTTITALQALSLLNNAFMVRQAEHFAERLAREASTPEDQIVHAYRVALGREPEADEMELLLDYHRQHGMAKLCRAILNSNEFLFVD